MYSCTTHIININQEGVGFYVTSLVLVCSRLASHVCIMFKFHLNLKWGFVKPSEIISGNDPDKNCFNLAQENVPDFLSKYWREVKFQPIFLGAQKFLFLAI